MTVADQIRSWEARAAQGDTHAMSELGAHYNRLGDIDTAHEWFFRAAEAGHARGAAYLGWLFILYGSVEDAIHWTRIAVERGDELAPDQLDRLLNLPDLDPLHPTVMMMNHRNLENAVAAINAGDDDLAGRLLHFGLESGDPEAMFMYGQWWERQGTLGHAIICYQRASNSPLPHSRAKQRLALLLASVRTGRVEAEES